MITETNIKNDSPRFYLSDKIFICAAFISSISLCCDNGLGHEYMLLNHINLRTGPEPE